MPSVSVIVPVHDAEATLGAQLEALAAQDFDGEWELVVADNGSTDGTVALVRKWTDRLPALRVVDARDRRGVSHARNVGAAAACGELLAICDADDVVTPGWLSALVAASADGDVLAGAFDEESLNPPDVRAWRRPRPTDEPAGSSWFRPYAVGANCAVWARVLDDIGGWDEAYVDGGNDVELSWRAQQHGYRLRFVPEAVVRYRYRSGLWSWARQSYAGGRAEPQLYADFRAAGMPPKPLWRTLRTWASLAVRTPCLVASRGRRGRWVGEAARAVGRVRGAVRSRVLFL